MDYEKFQDLTKFSTDVSSGLSNTVSKNSNNKILLDLSDSQKTTEDCINDGKKEDDDEKFSIESFETAEELELAMQRRSLENADTAADILDPIIGKSASKPVVSWIQCDRPECQKWRKVDMDDVSSLSQEKWYCSQNTDKKRNSCAVSEEEWTDESGDESIYASYKPGVIVLGKMPGYPWWPAIVEDDPDFDSYFYLQKSKEGGKIVKISYHLTFFGREASRAWLSEHCVRNFTGIETDEELGLVSGKGTSALLEAKEALKLPLQNRVRDYGFLKRYAKKPYPMARTGKTKKRRKADKIKIETTRRIRSENLFDTSEDDTQSSSDLDRTPAKKNSQNLEGSFSPVLFSPRAGATKQYLKKALKDASCSKADEREEMKKLIKERMEEKLSQEDATSTASMDGRDPFNWANGGESVLGSADYFGISTPPSLGEESQDILTANRRKKHRRKNRNTFSSPSMYSSNESSPEKLHRSSLPSSPAVLNV
jgi:hypothetical protein